MVSEAGSCTLLHRVPDCSAKVTQGGLLLTLAIDILETCPANRDSRADRSAAHISTPFSFISLILAI